MHNFQLADRSPVLAANGVMPTYHPLTQRLLELGNFRPEQAVFT